MCPRREPPKAGVRSGGKPDDDSILDDGLTLGDVDGVFAHWDDRANALLVSEYLGITPRHVDSTVVAQAPKLAPHIPAMVARIAQALGLDASRVNVKAKTAERLGPVGQGLSIEARAVALLASV